MSPPLTRRRPPQAPVHELGRQIQVVNLYLREASSTSARKRKHQEIQDEQDLAHLLEDLIAAHRQLKADSIYTLSTKPSVWETSEALEEALPEALPRLLQRDREMIMVPQLLRRWARVFGWPARAASVLPLLTLTFVPFSLYVPSLLSSPSPPSPAHLLKEPASRPFALPSFASGWSAFERHSACKRPKASRGTDRTGQATRSVSTSRRRPNNHPARVQ